MAKYRAIVDGKVCKGSFTPKGAGVPADAGASSAKATPRHDPDGRGQAGSEGGGN
jgi:hypothetical protein